MTPNEGNVVSGGGFEYAPKCNNVSISQFTLNSIHKGWITSLLSPMYDAFTSAGRVLGG